VALKVSLLSSLLHFLSEKGIGQLKLGYSVTKAVSVAVFEIACIAPFGTPPVAVSLCQKAWLNSIEVLFT
jgi:hypothetical protein